jgi:polyisoprenoid-binding protein YceI
VVRVSPGPWDVDPTNSSVEFQIKQLMIGNVRGPPFRVAGDLTIKDVTREIELESTVEGVERDPFGNERLGLSWRGTINRMDFGFITWQRGIMLGDEVKIIVDISAIHAA